MPTPEQVRAAVETYAKALSAGDREEWVSNFTAGATLTDPVGSPPNVGHEAIGGFWDTTHQMADTIQYDVRDVVVCGDEAAVAFTITARSGQGGVTFDGFEVFVVADDGRITSMKAWWDPARMQPLPAQ